MPAHAPISQLVFLVGLIVLIIGGLLIKAGRVAAAAAVGALFDRSVDRARRCVAAWPGRLFLLGLANGLAGGIVILALLRQMKSAPLCGLLAVLLTLVLLALTLLGRAGLYGWLGGRISAAPGEPIPEILKGGAVVETASLAPILGWLAELVLACIALGAGVFVLFSRRSLGRDPRRGAPTISPTGKDGYNAERDSVV